MNESKVTELLRELDESILRLRAHIIDLRYLFKSIEVDGVKAVEVPLATDGASIVQERIWTDEEEDAYRMRHSQ